MQPSTELSQLLLATAKALAQVARGQATNTAMQPVAAAQKAGVQALLFHALRHWGWTQACIKVLAPKPPKPAVHALLCVTLALLVFPKKGVAYDPHTLVNQAVAACRLNMKLAHAHRMVNACLRRAQREQDALLSQLAEDELARYNLPLWWLEKLRIQYPRHWQAIAQAQSQPAPMVLRVNTRMHTQQAYQELLSEQGMPSHAVGPAGLVLDTPVPVSALPGFGQGAVSVQDGAAQIAAELVWQGLRGDHHSPPKILDACAAPGGKTAHILELGDAQVLALEVDEARSQRIHDTLARLGLSAEVVVADASQAGEWATQGPWDAILLDAPCSASGIVRRHPDIVWLRRESDIEALRRVQAELLEALWPQLKVGGCLVYATCSVFREEGEQQAQSFSERHPDATRLDAPGHLLPQRAELETEHEMSHNVRMAYDGFFYAIFQKR